MTPPSLTIGGATVWFGAPDGHLEECIEESWPADGPQAKLLFRCNWSDRYKVAQALMGTSLFINGQIVRVAPAVYPFSPNLFCAELGAFKPVKGSIVQSGANAGLPQFNQVYIPAIFRRPAVNYGTDSPGGQNDPSGQPWTTTTTNNTGSVFQPPTGTYLWTAGANSGAKVPEGSIGIVRGESEITMTRRWMPYVPLNYYMDNKAHANLNPIQIADRIFAKGQILFAAMSSRPESDSQGNFTQEVTYTFMGRDQDWNAIMDDTGVYNLINTHADGSGNYPFPYVDWWANLP